MPYQEETIKTIVDRMNTQYFLPSIQRNYVWKPNQVILLFDSIMRGYPISSFLFWELEQENRDKWEVYKFCEEAISTGSHHIKFTAVHGLQNMTLVLDGQQRLTSMWIGLNGVFRIRRLYQRYDPAIYPVYKLYIDLFTDPTPVNDENEFTGKPYYSFLWSESQPKNDQNHYWFKVGRILDCHNDNEFYKMRENIETTFPAEVSKTQENMFERNFWRLYQAIFKDAAISYYIEREQDYDRVLDIFVRANEGGTVLTKPEIIQSMLESKWAGGAVQKINNLIGQANYHSLRPNSINLEFIMRACLVLANLPVRYRINTFTNQNVNKIEELWPRIVDAILRTLTIVNKSGIDNSNLTSLNALIPLVLYVFQNPNITFLGTTPFEVQNARRMRRWLILALLNRVFSRGAEQVLSNLRQIITSISAGGDFPEKAIITELTRMRFIMTWDENAIRSFLGSVYRVDFFRMSLLYDDHFWDVVSVEQDHIFPKSLFNSSNPSFAALSPEKQQVFLGLCNRIANLELLKEDENRKKLATPFSEWITTRDLSFRRTHLIPENDDWLKFENFDKFIAAREELITNRLKNLV